MKKNKTYKIVIIFAVISLVATLGSIFVNLGIDWFNSLTRPNDWISNIIIPIVWSIIYLTFAVVFFFWIKNHTQIAPNTYLGAILNGSLNVLWCLIFFSLNQLLWGLVVIILNLIAGWILWTQILNNKKTYGWILIIYPIWLSIATCLNLALWILN